MTPGTPLPWEWLPDEGQFIVTPEPHRAIVAEIPCQGANTQDGAYIVHTANAYPELVKALRIMVANEPRQTKAKELAREVLRKLGETAC